MVGNVAVIWKVRPTPSRQIARGFLPAVSWPSRLIRPLSGIFWPLSISKHVLFPAPLGPISARISPALSANDTLRTAWTPPEDLLKSSTASSVGAILIRRSRSRARVQAWTIQAWALHFGGEA